MAKGNNLTGVALAQSETPPESGGASRSAEEIRQNIAATRESITDTVDKLSDRVHQTFDWRTYISEYPLAALGVAVGLGVLASAILKPRPTPGERMKAALADSIEDFTGNLRSQVESATKQRPSLNQTIKAAATGLIVKGATDFVRNRISGNQSPPQENEDGVYHSRP